MFPTRSLLTSFVALALWAAFVATVRADAPTDEPVSPAADDFAEEFTFHHDGRPHTITARIVVEAADGGLLAQADDGVLWSIERRDFISRKPLNERFKPLTHAELAERMIVELPPGFRAHITPHYVVCYNTSRAYAQWTSSLLERLHKAFTNYWQNQGLELREPEFPLPVVVFADRMMYDHASRRDLPGGTGVGISDPPGRVPPGGIIAYYSLRSNRINMFDLTGTEALRGGGTHRGSLREINQMLSQPAAVPLVATIVHEATHQIAFNCGLSARYADIPLWLCEGMAVYFEAPDLTSTRGWRGIGRINYARLETFRDNLSNWQPGSLERLIASDERFRNPRTAAAAYADAWALNYYLIKHESAAYAEYLKTLAQKPPLIEDDRNTRLAEFRDHFGGFPTLQREFLKQMSRLR